MRVREFDAMRGIGVMAVMIVHCWWVKPLSPLSAAVRKMLPVNFISVDMFFVISGYLITGILLRSLQSPDYFRSFYARRALRILPAYYFCLLVLFMLLTPLDASLRDSAVPQYWWAYLLHIQNWILVAHPEGLGWPGTNHWWSLAVEEQFYLVWPAVVFLARTPERLRRACVAFIAFCLATKIALVATHAGWHALHNSTLTRVDCLAAGALVATLPRQTAARFAHRALFAAGTALASIVILIATQPNDHAVAQTAAITSLAALLFGAITLRIHGGVPSGRLLREPLFIWLGERSYGIYLVHLPLFFLLVSDVLPRLEFLREMPVQLRSATLFAATVALSVWAAALLHRYVEMPALQLRDRLPQRALRRTRRLIISTTTANPIAK